MAPGKDDVSMSHTHEERFEAWDKWSKQQKEGQDLDTSSTDAAHWAKHFCKLTDVDEGTAIAGTYVDRHKTAALCLHDQEFGFTREMLAMVDGSNLGEWSRERYHRVKKSLAENIEALLPLENKE